MNIQTKINRRNKEGKSGKANTREPKSARARHVRPLEAKQFVDIIEHMNDGVVVLDKNWHYVYVNQKAARMLQREGPSDLIGKHIWTEYPEGVGQPFQMAYEKAMREQTAVVFEDHYEPWDLWFENRIYPSPDSLMILFTDITQRKRIERLLEDRQHLLHKILDTEPGVVYIYDLEERRNVYVNRHWLSAFGYTAEETQAMGDELATQIFHPQDLPLIAGHHANWSQASEGEIRTIEYRIHSKAGEWRWLYSRETPFLRDESGQVRQILGIAHDVTEQTRMEAEVLREKEFSENMLNSLPGIFYFFDHTGRYLRWNKNLEIISGYSAEDIAQMHPLDFFEGGEKEYIAERIQQVFERGESAAEANFTAKNRQLFPYYFTGKRIEMEGQPYLIGMGIDISERKRADMAVREREKQLSSIYEAVGDVIFQLAVEAEGMYRFTSANQAFFKMTGLSRELLLGKRVDEVIPESSLSNGLQKYKEAVETGKIVRWEEVSEYPTGTLTGEVSIAPVFDDNGHCTHLVGAVHDITERKRAEQENKMLLHDLQERVKEMTALHNAARIQQQEGVDIPSMVRELASLLPPAFQYPELTVAHVQLGDEEAMTPGFANATTLLRTEFMTADGQIGSIQVGYTQDRPFLVEERALINTLADMLRTFYDRKQAEEALRLSESRYRAVVENQTEFIVRWKPDGTRTFVNEAYCRYFGLTPEQALSASFMPLILEEDWEAMQAKISRLVSGHVLNETDVHRVIKPDGGIGWQEWVDQAIYDESGQIVEFQSVGRDVTERKRMDEELRDAEIRYRTLVESTRAIFWRAKPNLEFIYVSPQAEQALGYPLKQWTSEPNFWKEHIHPDDQEIAWSYCLRKIQNMVPHEFEYRMITANGNIIWVRDIVHVIVENNKPREALGVIIDITERKRTEDALASSEAEFRALFAAMDDVLLLIDRDGVYRKVAPTNPRLLYKPREELLGKRMQDVFPAEQAETFISAIRQVLDSQQTARIEYQLVIDGQEVWFDTSISPMDSDNALWMARDITDRKRAEERLRQLNEELESRIAARTEELAAAMIKAQESDRLKSAFLATMSHELRTPLNSIIGFTGVILQGLAGPLNEEQTKQLNMTRDSARHLLALINDVLDISKIEAGQLEIRKRPFDMRQTIENVLRVVQPLAQKKNLHIETFLGSDGIIIDNDRRRVEQVLINLVNNAIKFTERGNVSIECQLTKDCLETSVRDHGIGIKPEDMDKLFKPFQQIETGLTRAHDGTGLGLAICKRLVTAMGGEITVESQWGVGSTFKFTLPM